MRDSLSPVVLLSAVRAIYHQLPFFIEEDYMAGQGSGGNVLAALCSFFIPGLGQLLQGRVVAAAVQFVLAFLLWFILLGWVVHLWSIIDAARFNPPGAP
jgi:TM2 domain-containing membrane protein YozV